MLTGPRSMLNCRALKRRITWERISRGRTVPLLSRWFQTLELRTRGRGLSSGASNRGDCSRIRSDIGNLKGQSVTVDNGRYHRNSNAPNGDAAAGHLIAEYRPRVQR